MRLIRVRALVRQGLLSPTSPTVKLHWLLEPPRSQQQPFHYDISKPPCSLLFLIPNTQHPSVLLEVATQPPLTRLQVELPTRKLPPVIVVNPDGVTVMDILKALYSALHAPTHRSSTVDFEHFQPGSQPYRRLSRSYEDHFAMTGGKPEARRNINDLKGRTTFVGLEPSREAQQTWILKTSAA